MRRNPLTLALLLPEALDDLHRREDFGDIGTDVRDPVLTGARNRADLASEEHDRRDHQRDADQQAQRQRRCEIDL